MIEVTMDSILDKYIADPNNRELCLNELVSCGIVKPDFKAKSSQDWNSVQQSREEHIIYDWTLWTKYRYLVIDGEIRLSKVRDIRGVRKAIKNGSKVYDLNRLCYRIKP